MMAMTAQPNRSHPARQLTGLWLAGLALLLAAAGCKSEPACGGNTADKNGVCVGTPLSTTECGPGTSFKDGECVPDCGPGTIFMSGACVAETSLCGANTKVVKNDAGGFTCVGTGGITSCGDAGMTEAGTCQPTCTPQLCQPSDFSASTACLSGRVFNVNGQVPLDGVAENLHARAYPPLMFVSNPTGTPPVGSDAPVDSCGYFKITMAAVDFTNDMAIGIAPKATGANNWILTGIAFKALKNTAIDGLSAFAVAIADDAAWSTMAGLPSGMGFASMGAILVVYAARTGLDAGKPMFMPVGGVEPLVAGSPVSPSSAFYFSDAFPKLATLVKGTISNMTIAGNGWALLAGVSSVSQLSGMCVGSGCSYASWQAILAAGPAGIYLVTERDPM